VASVPALRSDSEVGPALSLSKGPLWRRSFYPPLRMADLVLGQKADSSTPKVKKCKKSVQNMLKTRSFLLIFVQNARVFVNFLSIFAHFYPHF
jgi:hypothetical protein